MNETFTSLFVLSFPSGDTKGAALLNQGPRMILMSLKEGVSYYSSVDQVIYILERSSTRAIIKVERTEYQLIEAIKSSEQLQDRVRKKINSMLLTDSMVSNIAIF